MKSSLEEYKEFCKREGLNPSHYHSLQIFIMNKINKKLEKLEGHYDKNE